VCVVVSGRGGQQQVGGSVDGWQTTKGGETNKRITQSAAAQHQHKVRPVPDDRLLVRALLPSVYGAHAPPPPPAPSAHHRHLLSSSFFFLFFLPFFSFRFHYSFSLYSFFVFIWKICFFEFGAN
jgi:hypothetical protein